MSDKKSSAIEALTNVGTTVSAKTTYWGAALTAVVSWYDALPTGVVFAGAVALAGYVTGVFFRYLDRRAKLRLEKLEEEFLRESHRMRQEEHAAKMSFYNQGRDTAGTPLS